MPADLARFLHPAFGLFEHDGGPLLTEQTHRECAFCGARPSVLRRFVRVPVPPAMSCLVSALWLCEPGCVEAAGRELPVGQPTPTAAVLDDLRREVARQSSIGPHFESDLQRVRLGLLRIADHLGIGTATPVSEHERLVMVLAMGVFALGSRP